VLLYLFRFIKVGNDPNKKIRNCLNFIAKILNPMEEFMMIIFGASGDLTRRKLMPALYYLHKEKRLPAGFTIIGTGRTKYTDEAYRAYILQNLVQFVPSKEQIKEDMDSFVQNLYYFPMDPEDGNEYILLNQRLKNISQNNLSGDLLFYLATPPSLYGVIPQQLKKIGLNGKNARIIVEKPFGYDLKTAIELNAIYASVFEENQIYRIDHFLGKETVQNILVFRFANGIFEPLWNRNYINYIEVTGVENLGVEQRGGFYDSAGALRDMVQNHLIQILAIIAMEPPATFNAENFRNEVVQVYESLKPLTEKDLKEHIIRGQYTASEYHPAYREEKNIAPDSRTETYIAMKLEIQNWRWSGVPFYIRTGKQMPTKVTEIVIHFREAPLKMFNLVKSQMPKENKLILRLQPNEGITLSFGMKVPGRGFEMKEVMMDFGYDSLEGIPTEDAYIRLIEDCIHEDPTLFTRSDAVEASWKFFEPVLEYWKNPDVPLHGYPAGSWGPLESEEMIHRYHAEWTNPCKNRTNTDIYCEL
jgi:glucose-6-phosphate 1-dehydrogenase